MFSPLLQATGSRSGRSGLCRLHRALPGAPRIPSNPCSRPPPSLQRLLQFLRSGRRSPHQPAPPIARRRPPPPPSTSAASPPTPCPSRPGPSTSPPSSSGSPRWTSSGASATRRAARCGLERHGKRTPRPSPAPSAPPRRGVEAAAAALRRPNLPHPHPPRSPAGVARPCLGDAPAPRQQPHGVHLPLLLQRPVPRGARPPTARRARHPPPVPCKPGAAAEARRTAPRPRRKRRGW